MSQCSPTYHLHSPQNPGNDDPKVLKLGWTGNCCNFGVSVDTKPWSEEFLSYGGAHFGDLGNESGQRRHTAEGRYLPGIDSDLSSQVHQPASINFYRCQSISVNFTESNNKSVCWQAESRGKQRFTHLSLSQSTKHYRHSCTPDKKSQHLFGVNLFIRAAKRGGAKTPSKSFIVPSHLILSTPETLELQDVRDAIVGRNLMGVWNGWGYGIAFFRPLKFQISGPEIWRKIALSAEIQGSCCKIRTLKNIFRALENGKSICHQSIPPLSAGRN